MYCPGIILGIVLHKDLDVTFCSISAKLQSYEICTCNCQYIYHSLVLAFATIFRELIFILTSDFWWIHIHETFPEEGLVSSLSVFSLTTANILD